MTEEYVMTEEQLERERWVQQYNASLPQKKWFCKEFGEEITIAVGGIHDSEYMNYVYDNFPSARIKQLLLKYLPEGTYVTVVCRQCGIETEPHTEEEHFDRNHPVHSCATGHRRNI